MRTFNMTSSYLVRSAMHLSYHAIWVPCSLLCLIGYSLNCLRQVAARAHLQSSAFCAEDPAKQV